MDDSKESGISMDKDEELQQKKIETAVKFLQNSRVRQTPMTQRRSFLEKKGLSKEEIDQAILKSGTAADEHNPPSTAIAPRVAEASQPMFRPTPHPIPWKGYFGAAVIGGGLGYLLVNVIKTYIIPLILNLNKKDEKLDHLETSVMELNANVNEKVGSLQTTLESVQELLVEEQKKIQKISSDLVATQDKLASLPTDSYSVGELKAEIVSLKGLLLNRKQFPSPVIGSTPAPGVGIPTWQRTTPALASFVRDGKVDESVSGATTDNGQGKGTKESFTAQDHSMMNGDSRDFDERKEESRSTSLQSFSSGSETCTDTPNTVKSNISERDMNVAVLLEDGDISNDTSVSSLSDMSGNASFNEASIAFSSTCIKVPSESTSMEEFPESTDYDSQDVD